MYQKTNFSKIAIFMPNTSVSFPHNEPFNIDIGHNLW
jgi:hypothetical protein